VKARGKELAKPYEQELQSRLAGKDEPTPKEFTYYTGTGSRPYMRERPAKPEDKPIHPQHAKKLELEKLYKPKKDPKKGRFTLKSITTGIMQFKRLGFHQFVILDAHFANKFADKLRVEHVSAEHVFVLRFEN